MKRLLPLAVALTVALAGCGKDEPAPTGTPAAAASPAAASTDPISPASDAKFAGIAKRWLDGAMQLSPVSATSIGDHRFDAEIRPAGGLGPDFGLGVGGPVFGVGVCAHQSTYLGAGGDGAGPSTVSHLR